SFIKSLSSFDANEVRYHIDKTLGEYLHDNPALAAVFADAERLATLQQAYDTARYELQHMFGQDSMAAATLEKSDLRKSFDAIRNSQLDVKLAKLNNALETVINGIGDYAHVAAGREFWFRLQNNLQDKDWPFSHDPEGLLMQELRR